MHIGLLNRGSEHSHPGRRPSERFGVRCWRDRGPAVADFLIPDIGATAYKASRTIVLRCVTVSGAIAWHGLSTGSLASGLGGVGAATPRLTLRFPTFGRFRAIVETNKNVEDRSGLGPGDSHAQIDRPVFFCEPGSGSSFFAPRARALPEHEYALSDWGVQEPFDFADIGFVPDVLPSQPCDCAGPAYFPL